MRTVAISSKPLDTTSYLIGLIMMAGRIFLCSTNEIRASNENHGRLADTLRMDFLCERFSHARPQEGRKFPFS
jgi:hypothetical protein